MYFSFLEPVKVMVNNVVKQMLPKYRDSHNLLNFDQFKTDGNGEDQGAGKKVRTLKT